MKSLTCLIPFMLAMVVVAGIAFNDGRADAPTFGGKECVMNCCDKASGAKEYAGCKSACGKAAQKDACLAECSQKMQKAYQACLVKNCKMDKGLAAVSIKCAK